MTSKIPKPRLKAATPADVAQELDKALSLVHISLRALTRQVAEIHKPAPVAEPLIPESSLPAVRLEALLTIFSGKSAQQVLQDMLETGRAPTREQLLQEADKLIARSPR